MALWVFVYLGTTPIGSILTGWVISAGCPRVAFLVGSGACLAAVFTAESGGYSRMIMSWASRSRSMKGSPLTSTATRSMVPPVKV